ncbi:hypothetical protein BJX70DRAFT_393413 [Aspergillus crustosus]
MVNSNDSAMDTSSDVVAATSARSSTTGRARGSRESTPSDCPMEVSIHITRYDTTDPTDSPDWVLVYGPHRCKGECDPDMTFITVTRGASGYVKRLEARPMDTFFYVRPWKCRRDICGIVAENEGKLLVAVEDACRVTSGSWFAALTQKFVQYAWLSSEVADELGRDIDGNTGILRGVLSPRTNARLVQAMNGLDTMWMPFRPR